MEDWNGQRAALERELSYERAKAERGQPNRAEQVAAELVRLGANAPGTVTVSPPLDDVEEVEAELEVAVDAVDAVEEAVEPPAKSARRRTKDGAR